jgi:hypothetical protein
VSGFEDTGAVEDEGQFLQSVYPPAHRYGGAGVFGLNPASYLDEGSPLATPGNAAKLHDEWARYWDLERPVLLEKSPPNLVHTRFLQRMFPNSCFVVLLRHPVSVTLATKKRGGIPLYCLFEHWVVCHERFAADLSHLERVHVVWYEDLVSRPQEALDEVCGFVGLGRTPLAEPIQSHNDRYLVRWEEMRQGGLGKAYSNRIVQSFEARVGPFGYSLSDTRRWQRCSLTELGGAARNQPARVTALSRLWSRGLMYWERVNRGRS